MYHTYVSNTVRACTCIDNNSVFLSSSAKKEEEDLEDKKSIKKRIKELKVLDPKIAQNLCKYLFPFIPLILPRTRFLLTYVCVVLASASPHNTVCTDLCPLSHKIISFLPLYMFFACYREQPQ